MKKIVLMVVILVIAALLSKVLFEQIYYSDMPVWLKYFLLK